MCFRRNKFTAEYVWGSYIKDLEIAEKTNSDPRPIPPPLGCHDRKTQEEFDDAYYALYPFVKERYEKARGLYRKKN